MDKFFYHKNYGEKLEKRLYVIALDVDGTIIDTNYSWKILTFPPIFKLFLYLGKRGIYILQPIEHFFSFLALEISKDNIQERINRISYFIEKFKECGISLFFLSDSFTFKYLNLNTPFFKSYETKGLILKVFKENSNLIAYITDSQEEENGLKNLGIRVIRVKSVEETFYVLKSILSRYCQNH